MNSYSEERFGKSLTFPDEPLGMRIFCVGEKSEIFKTTCVKEKAADSLFEFIYFADGEDCLIALREQKCDLLVTHMVLPGMDGLELLAKVKLIRPCLPMLLFVGHGELSLGVRAIKAGALDIIESPINRQEFLNKINSVLKASHAGIPSMDSLLSNREIEVLKLLVAGESNKEIAYKLNVSVRTIEFHRGRIMRKLKIDRFSDMVKIAIVMGLTTLEVKKDIPDSTPP